MRSAGEESSKPAEEKPATQGFYDLAGHTLGKYRLVQKLGQGGMAQVYKAYQPDLERYVALKVLHPHLTGDDEFAVRFRREARAIAMLEHPHIVRVYDFDTDGDLAFLVMEYLEGTSLREHLRELDRRGERMSLEEVDRIVGAVADALDYAHRQGVVHRDIKPSNVLLGADARPVLTDFGIARMVAATAITQSSGALGTPAYMSPEQGQGAPGDARSDIYSLGVLTYQFCTGQVPFDADTPYAVILKHITAPLRSPRTLRPDLPEAVERVILKALAKKPEDRYQTAGEMGRALQVAIVLPQRIGAYRHCSTLLRRWWLLGVALVCIVLLGVISYMALRSWQGEAPPYFPARVLKPTRVVAGVQVLALRGPRGVDDTWIDPDTPDETWYQTDLVHLQGPLTPDRILLRFDLSSLPQQADVISATLTLRVERWEERPLPAVAVAYRILAPWDVKATTYKSPWLAPGLMAGRDYDPTPLGMAPLPDAGLLVLDVTRAFFFWRTRGEPNHGLMVAMSKDSHNQAHYWVFLSEQPAPEDRPALHIAYEVAP